MPARVSLIDFQHTTNPVGAAAGCDLLILLFKNQKIAAYGSSYRTGISWIFPTGFDGCPSELRWLGFGCR
ncbi:hypothetical protein EMIT0347P_40135 [Pseudomonas sp. IT-347P]